ncbi:MAG TPA: hypothetical protein VE309_02855 [Caulobacteraceae bacterium]|nr:hypothetical protein [Caulobacteraceae bacterium]
MPSQYGPLLPYIIPLLIVLLIVRRGLMPRKIKVERMWVLPALLVFASASMFASAHAPSPLVVAELAAALAAGAVVGWYRGRLTHISIDPETHDLTSKTSPVGLVLLAVLFAARYGVRLVLPGTGAGEPGSLATQASAIADALALFGIGALVIQRLEMWMRCNRLLAEARAGR